MRYRIITVVACMCLVSVVAFAGQGDPEIKYSQPKKLRSLESDFNHIPDAAWNGSRLAVVYDDYRYQKSSYSAYLMFVDINGSVTKGPIKLSNETCSLAPRIVWTGSKFGIVYAAGTKDELNYYLDCYNSSGSRVSRTTLPGSISYAFYATRTNVHWMGNQFGIFYYAKLPDERYIQYPLFYRTAASGTPSVEIINYDSYPSLIETVWDGKRFVVLAAETFCSFKNRVVTQVMILDSNGKLIKDKTDIVASDIYFCSGLALVPLKNKTKYLVVAAGEYFEGNSVPPAQTTRRDLFTAQVKVKSKKIGNINVKNATRSTESGWDSPTGISMGGGKLGIAASHGCGIGFFQLNDKGNMVGKPVYHSYGY